MAELSAHQGDPPDRDQGVVLALGQAAVVVVDLGLGRGARGAGFGIGGVAHAGGGVLGEERFPPGPRFGGQFPGEGAVAVAALLRADGDPAFARAFGVVGCGAVLVEQEQGQLGELVEFLGSDAGRGADQVGLESVAGASVDEAGQFGDRLADDLDVLGGDLPAGLGGRGRGQYGFQGFAEQVIVAVPVARPRSVGGLLRWWRFASGSVSTSFQDLAPISLGVASACSRANNR